MLTRPSETLSLSFEEQPVWSEMLSKSSEEQAKPSETLSESSEKHTKPSETLPGPSERLASKSGQRAELRNSQKNLQKPLDLFPEIL